MENITKEQQWVSINDRLPDIKKKVLIYVSSDNDKLTGLHVGHRMPGDNFWIISGKFSFDVGDVTHWTTLPQLPASGSVAAPKEEKSEDFGKLKWKVGQILAEQFLKYNDGKFIAAIELNPATHALTEFIESENTALREALKDLLAITETNVFNYNEYKAIIERARKLLK